MNIYISNCLDIEIMLCDNGKEMFQHVLFCYLNHSYLNLNLEYFDPHKIQLLWVWKRQGNYNSNFQTTMLDSEDEM